MKNNKVNNAILLAAGLGTRLMPITKEIPKPLIEVNGIRIIDRAINYCAKAGIQNIHVVVGYLGNVFEELLIDYPCINIIKNPDYDIANNISSVYSARDYLEDTYIIDADTLIYNSSVIKNDVISSFFYGIKTNSTDDWIFRVENCLIQDEVKGGEGNNIWKVVGISYWNKEDGKKLAKDIEEYYCQLNRKDLYWEFVPLKEKKNNYTISIMNCNEADIMEIDTFEELLSVDSSYKKFI